MIKILDIIKEASTTNSGVINFVSGTTYDIKLPKSKLHDIIDNFAGERGAIELNKDYSINVNKIYHGSGFGKQARTFFIEASVSQLGHSFGYTEKGSPTEKVIFKVSIV